MINVGRNFSIRPGCFFAMFGALFMFIALVLLAIAGYQMFQQQRYQSGRCTITAKQLLHDVSTSSTTNSDGSKTYTTTDVYSPYFEYRVRTADGRTFTAGGYDGSNSYASGRAGQQAIIDHYYVGESYQCWYNPDNPNQAVLVRQPNWVLFLVGGIFLLVGGI